MTFKFPLLTGRMAASRTSSLHSAPESWHAKASCSGEDPNLFSLPDNFNERDKARIFEASKICEGCPVQTECYVSATEDDLDHTTRGGYPPRVMNFVERGRPVKLTEEEEATVLRFLARGVCPKGHEIKSRELIMLKRTKPNRPRYAYCRICVNTRERNRRVKIAA